MVVLINIMCNDYHTHILKNHGFCSHARFFIKCVWDIEYRPQNLPCLNVKKCFVRYRDKAFSMFRLCS